MNASARIALLAALGWGLAACASAPAPTGPDPAGKVPATAGVTGQLGRQIVSLDRALITARRGVLGLAIHDRNTGPDMANLAPGAWYLGIRFRPDRPEPALELKVVNYGTPWTEPVARARLLHVDRRGVKHDVPIVRGRLRITNWAQRHGLITTVHGSLTLQVAGGGRLAGTFAAPVQGWYGAP